MACVQQQPEQTDDQISTSNVVGCALDSSEIHRRFIALCSNASGERQVRLGARAPHLKGLTMASEENRPAGDGSEKRGFDREAPVSDNQGAPEAEIREGASPRPRP